MNKQIDWAFNNVKLKDWYSVPKGTYSLDLVNHWGSKINFFLHILIGEKASSGRNLISPTLKKVWRYMFNSVQDKDMADLT